MKRANKDHIKTEQKPAVQESADISSPGFMEKLIRGDYDEKFRTIQQREGIKFKDDFCRQVYFLSRLGARDKEVALFFGVNEYTVQQWKDRHPDYMENWLLGKYGYGMKVVETFGQKMMGYDYVEIEHSQQLDRNGRVRTLRKVTHKHMPPDTAALIFYLKTQFKEGWTETNRIDVQSHVQLDISQRLEGMQKVLSPEELNLVKSIAIKSVSQMQGVSNN